MPKLVFIDRNFTGRVYPLTIEKTTVGRSDENVLVIRDSSLSARHCEILVNGTEVIVRDLGSRNGTLVDGRMLRNQQSAVKNGQIVRFGLVDARVEIESAAWGDETNPESAVFDHRQIMRDQRRAQKNPAPPAPAMKLDSAAPASNAESEPKTILAPVSAPVAQAPSPSESPAGETREQPQGRRIMLACAVVVVAALLLVWLIWGRK
jgi:predicted component of type VI protein secretion system